MTFNGSWGHMPYAPEEDWHSARKVVQMVQQVTSGEGNLLLNIGPAPDGSVPPEATRRLVPVGKWLNKNGEAVYGKVDRIYGRLDRSPLGRWTLRGKTAYFWCDRWPGREITIGGVRTRLKKATLLPSGKTVRFLQTQQQLKNKQLNYY